MNHCAVATIMPIQCTALACWQRRASLEAVLQCNEPLQLHWLSSEMIQLIQAYSVDSRLINARFVSYNNQAPPPSMASCVPSCLPDVMHVTLSPRTAPSFLHTASDQNWRWEPPGNKTRSICTLTFLISQVGADVLPKMWIHKEFQSFL